MEDFKCPFEVNPNYQGYCNIGYACDGCPYNPDRYIVSVGYIGWRGSTTIHQIGIFDNEKEAQEYVSIKRKQEHNDDWFENNGNPTIFIIEGNGKREFNSKVVD